MKKHIYIALFFIILNSLKLLISEGFILSVYGNGLFNSASLSKFLLYVFSAIIIFLFLIKFKNRNLLILFYILQACYLFTHIAYHLYFKELFHAQQFFLQFREGLDLVMHFALPVNPRYFIILLDAPLFIFIVVYFPEICKSIAGFQKYINQRRIIFFIFLIVSIPFCFKPNPIEAYVGTHSELRSEFREKIIIERYGLLVNDILDMMFSKYGKVLIKSLSEGDKVSFVATENKRFNNIICIQVETLDANIVNYKHKEKYVAPFLHRLSLNSIYYPYMLSYSSAGGTADIEFVIINGLMPLQNFPFFRIPNYDYPNSFLKILSNAGFDILAFHNNEGYFFSRKESFKKMGFHNFYDLSMMGLKPYGWGGRDEDMFSFVIDKLKQQNSPFFYYIITMSSHEPFSNARLYYLNEHYNDINEAIKRDYFNSISYVDQTLERFVSFVMDNLPDTYIFIFGDHIFYSDMRVFRPAITYNPKAKAVPLIIVTPDKKKYMENKSVASMLDMGLTILNASNVNFEIVTRGVNLLNIPIKGRLIDASYSYKEDRNVLFRKFNKLISGGR